MNTSSTYRNSEILVLDVGTSALKATLYSTDGTIMAQAAQGYTYTSPEPNSAEADPDDWWHALPRVLEGLKQDLRAVRIIGLTGQMHSPVLLDERGEPLKPCLLWLDRRCTRETAELADALNLPPYYLNSTYTLPKLAWLARHRPEMIARTHRILFPKDYIRYRLTGFMVTDASEAGGAALLDWRSRQWATERLSYANLDASVLPPLLGEGELAGPVLDNVADALGLPRQTQVITGVGDVAAILGGAPIEPGRVMLAMGTSSMLYVVLPEHLHDLRDEEDGIYPYDLCGFRLLGGVSSLTGGALDWAWRAFGKASELSFVEAAQIVQMIPPGADGLIFIPYLAGERSPFWRDDLRGMFVGLHLGHTWAHMLRAVLEGVGLCTRLMLERFARLGIPSPTVAVSGGAVRHAIWQRVLSDTCQRILAVYNSHSAASNVIYALCMRVLEPCLSFAEALNRVFGLPTLIMPDETTKDTYAHAYALYNHYLESMLEVRSRSPSLT